MAGRGRSLSRSRPSARFSRGRGGASGRAGNMAEAEGESLESWLSEYPPPRPLSPGPFPSPQLSRARAVPEAAGAAAVPSGGGRGVCELLGTVPGAGTSVCGGCALRGGG